MAEHGVFIGLECKVRIKQLGNDGSWATLAGQRDATLNINISEIDVTTKDSRGGWEEVIAGQRSWNMSCDGAQVEGDESTLLIEDAMINPVHSQRTGLLEAEIEMLHGGNYRGRVLVTGFTKNLPQNDLVTYSLTLRGTGPLERAGGAPISGLAAAAKVVK